ncbi:MAG: hypothetical protein L0Y55_15170, partial [Anaerolineales bacterium]|nr:hypothetical protein [Anaerolineales bacterium]
GVTKLGPREITFYFDKPTNCISPDAFVIEQDGVAGDLPAVSSVLPVADNGLLVTLSRPIEPKAWTTITHGPTLASTRIGYLPGDVNGDGYSGPVDILDLIDSLNGVGGSLSLSSADLDRSGMATPADIIMLIDLLNGAGNLDPYLGEQLP